jgi:catalase-peroxidase
MTNSDTSKCPFHAGAITAAGTGTTNSSWWPNQLNVKVLHNNPAAGVPMDPDFDYAEAFSSLDLDAVIADLTSLMTNSQEWLPARCGKK